MISIIKENGIDYISVDGELCGKIIPCEGAADSFTELENGAWKWHRKTECPTDSMRMELLFIGEPTFNRRFRNSTAHYLDSADCFRTQKGETYAIKNAT